MTYPLHIRKKILAELAHSTYRAVAAKYGVSTTALQNWQKQPEPKVDKTTRPAKSIIRLWKRMLPSIPMTTNGNGLPVSVVISRPSFVPSND